MRMFPSVLALVPALFLGACGTGIDKPAPVMAGSSSSGGACLAPEEVKDSDHDFQRNAAALSDPALCVSENSFSEDGRIWRLQHIRNSGNPGRALWVVPHDNENAAFDTAVYAARTYGGTVVAIETGGSRNAAGQDPNRNFDLGSKCPQQQGPSPLYTQKVLEHHVAGAPIVALHTNSRGGPISVKRPPPNVVPFPSPTPIGNPPDDTLVFVASTSPPDADLRLKGEVAALNAKGINVFYEVVSSGSVDCSLSNYAALKGIRPYYNIEVADGDGATQRRMVDILMALPGAR